MRLRIVNAGMPCPAHGGLAARIYGTGVDLLSLERFASLLASSRSATPHAAAAFARPDRLARRILCAEELADWQRLGATHDRTRWLACRCVAHVWRATDQR